LEPNVIKDIAAVLAATGPYGFIAVLGWAFVKTTERKDAELRSIYNKLVGLTEAQTAALTKVEHALVSLKEAIERIGK
jgi:hypothetical protein